MKKILQISKWLLIAVFILIAALIILAQFVSFSMDEDQMQSYFEESGFTPTFGFVTYEEREIHYVDLGNKSKPMAVFVHGSPGSWDAFISIMTNNELLDKYRVVAIDRPGFGKSGSGKPERSLMHQAGAVSAVVNKLDTSTPIILVGHSYGGPVIARMVMDEPDMYDGLIIVAGSIDPQLEETKWFQIPVHYKILSWILPDMAYSSNEEILALKPELEEMMPMWETITIPVEVIQGEEDKLVPPGNADFAKKMLINSDLTVTRLDDVNHFIPWTRSDLIINALNRMIDLEETNIQGTAN